MDKTMTHEEIVKRTLEDQNLINKEKAKKAWIQTEEITFYPFPETKPTYSGEFIVRETDQPTARGAWFSNSTNKRRFSALRTRAGQPHHVILWNVVEWAEMPKGYTEET